MGGAVRRLFPQYPDAVSDLGKVVCHNAAADRYVGIKKDNGVPRWYNDDHRPGGIDLAQKKHTKSINVLGKLVYLSVPDNVEAGGNLPDNVRNTISVEHIDDRKRSQSTSRGVIATIGLDTQEQILGAGARLERAVSDHVGEGSGHLKFNFCFPVARFNVKREMLATTSAMLISEVFVGVSVSATVHVSGDPQHQSRLGGISATGGMCAESGITAKVAGKSSMLLQRGLIVEEIHVHARGVTNQSHSMQGHSLDTLAKDLMRQALKCVQQPKSWQVLYVDVVNDNVLPGVSAQIQGVDEILRACNLTEYKSWFADEEYSSRTDMQDVRRADLTSKAGMKQSEASRLLKELDPHRMDRSRKMSRLLKILSSCISQESLDIIEDEQLTQSQLEKISVDELKAKLGPKDARKVKELLDRTAVTASPKSSMPGLSEIRLSEAARACGEKLGDQPGAPFLAHANFKSQTDPPQTAFKTACSLAGTVDVWQGEHCNRLLDQFCQVEGALIQQKIGKGQSGVVFLVCKPEGQTMAVKAMCTEDGSKAEKAVNEARALQKICHPNIVMFFESRSSLTATGFSEILLFMEFCRGGTLQQELEQRHRKANDYVDHKPVSLFSDGEVASVAKQLICALAYCVQMGFVHGDVKPQNVLLDKQDQGKDMKVKLCDFSEVNLGTGTPLYMSPQRLAAYRDKSSNKRFNKEKADAFSLGLTILTIHTTECCVQGLNEDKNELAKRRDHIRAPDDAALFWLRTALQQMLRWREEARDGFSKLGMLIDAGPSICAPQHEVEEHHDHKDDEDICNMDESHSVRLPQELPSESELCCQCHRNLPLTKDWWGREALSSFVHRRTFPNQHINPSQKKCTECRAGNAPPDGYCADCGVLLRYKGSDKNTASAQKKRRLDDRRCQKCVANKDLVAPDSTSKPDQYLQELQIDAKLDTGNKQCADEHLLEPQANSKPIAAEESKQINPDKHLFPTQIHCSPLQNTAASSCEHGATNETAASNFTEGGQIWQLVHHSIQHRGSTEHAPCADVADLRKPKLGKHQNTLQLPTCSGQRMSSVTSKFVDMSPSMDQGTPEVASHGTSTKISSECFERCNQHSAGGSPDQDNSMGEKLQSEAPRTEKATAAASRTAGAIV